MKGGSPIKNYKDRKPLPDKRVPKVGNIELFTPHRIQADILHACLDPETFYVTAVIGRQFGKSTLGMNLALYWAINDPKCVVWWVSPTSTQALKVQHEIINAVHKSRAIKEIKKGKDNAQLVFTNGSVIHFKSAGSGDSLRGSSVNYLICDEAATISTETVDAILKPTLGVTGKKMVCLGTPKGRSNWLYTAYTMGLNDTTKRFRSFTCTSMDNPYANLQLLAEWKLSLPENLYRQEILAEFVDGAGVFQFIVEAMVLPKKQGCGEAHVYAFDNPPNENKSNNKYRDNCFPESQQGPFYIGIDIGMASDYTVACIIDGNGNLIHYYRWNRLDGNQIAEKLIKIIKKWKPAMTYLEANNQGLPIYDNMKLTLGDRNFRAVYTTSKSKPEMINNLVYAFNTKSIKIVNCDQLRIELENFIFIQTDSGYVKYQAATGKDDMVMALALGRKCYLENKSSGLYNRIY